MKKFLALLCLTVMCLGMVAVQAEDIPSPGAITVAGEMLTRLTQPGLTVEGAAAALESLGFVPSEADVSVNSENLRLRYEWDDRISVLIAYRENEDIPKVITVAIDGQLWTDGDGNVHASNEDMLGYVCDTMNALSAVAPASEETVRVVRAAYSWQLGGIVVAIPEWANGSPMFGGMLSIDLYYQ